MDKDLWKKIGVPASRGAAGDGRRPKTRAAAPAAPVRRGGERSVRSADAAARFPP